MRVAALVHRPEELGLIPLGKQLGEVTAITVAPPDEKIEALLGHARGLGASRTVRMWDPSMETTDYLGVAYALAATVRALFAPGAELAGAGVIVLCGSEGRGAVGPAIAERLAVPHLSEVVAAEQMDDRVVAKRRSGAVVRMYAAKPPVVLCAAPPPLQGAIPAAGETEVWTLGQAGLTAAELSYRKRFRPHTATGPKAQPRVFTDAAQLAARLKADGLLAGGR
jgi:electron transfer flavoprotein alpha/beta subunit